MNKLNSLVKKITGKAREILVLVRDKPRLTAKEIQQILKIQSGNTFYKHKTILLEEKLLKNELDGKDKRKKQYEITNLGKDLVQFMEKQYLRAAFIGFLHYCGIKYLRNHPEITDTKNFDVLIRNPDNVPLEFIEEVKELTEEFIKKTLTN